MKAPKRLTLVPLAGVPRIAHGDDLPQLLSEAAAREKIALEDGVLVVCQKIISLAEGQTVDLSEVEPSARAIDFAEKYDKDARQVEVVLQQSKRIVREGPGILICETQHGFVCANAGVDRSNAPGPDIAILLPVDPDASAARLRDGLEARGARNLAVIVSDTFGRPWREGLVDIAIGSAGIAPTADLRGELDLSGRPLEVTTPATADQLAAAAGILMVKNAGVPAVWIDGIRPSGDGRIHETLRDSAQDLFR